MFYGVSNWANPWIVKSGPAPIMYTCGGSAMGMALLGLPIWVFGKRLRSFWARYNLIAMLGMQSKTTDSISH